MSNRVRWSWILGAVNGLLAVAAVDAAYTTLSTPGIWLVPSWIAVPYGAFTAWRAKAYVQRLLEGSANYIRPPLEGFLLMAASTIGYGLYMAVRAGSNAAPLDTAMFLWTLYAAPVGAFGSVVALALMLFDIWCVRWLRRSALEPRRAV